MLQFILCSMKRNNKIIAKFVAVMKQSLLYYLFRKLYSRKFNFDHLLTLGGLAPGCYRN